MVFKSHMLQFRALRKLPSDTCYFHPLIRKHVSYPTYTLVCSQIVNYRYIDSIKMMDITGLKIGKTSHSSGREQIIAIFIQTNPMFLL